MLPQLFFAYRPLKKGLKTPRWPQNRFFKKEANIQMLPDFVYKVYMRLKNFQKKSFLKPTSQKNYFAIFLTPKFWKKIFFQLKNRMVKVGCGAQKCIPEHFFGCSKCPLYHMSISQKFILDSKILVFWGSEGVKIPYFSRQKFFFEIWTYGIRGT